MRDPFFSIIIPTYQAQDYLRRCLHSCVAQSFSEIEILVIDDCGGDDSLEIAQEFASQDARVRIVSNPCNLGAFHSRLVGIGEARGEYILFLDSDDYLALNACEVISRAVTQDRVDILVFNIAGCLWDPVINTLPSSKAKADKKLYGASICARAYAKEILQKSLLALDSYFPKLPKLNLHEDALLSFLFLYYCQRYKIILDVLYFYSNNPQSLSRKKDKAGEFHILNMQMVEKRRIKDLFEYFDRLPYKDEVFETFKTRFKTHMENILRIHRAHKIVVFCASRSGFLAYPKGIVLRHRIVPSWKNPVKIILYFLSFGKFKKF